MKYTILTVLVAVFFVHIAAAQIVKPVKWTFSTRQVNPDQVDLIYKATIISPWHMYGLHIAEGGPIPITINFNGKKGFELIGKPTQSPKPKVVDDKIFNMRLELHSGQVTFTQRIKKIQIDSLIINGTLEYMTCSDMQCVLGDQDFAFVIKGNDKPGTTGAVAAKEQSPINVTTDTAVDANVAAITTVYTDTITGHKQGYALTDIKQPQEAGTAKKSLWGVFFLALLAGLGGLLTPCVYPMIPMTVSFFLRGNKSRSRAVSEALVFGFSIVFLYTLIGVLVAVFKNPNAVNNFTTHWVTNLIFFGIFIILSASFFGMFEIMLPSGLANRVDRQADKGGYLGAFFMAVAMAILSFSCTGPIVASLLIKASQGALLEPIIGMAGFSVVFALPFTLFAIFPSWLQGLPKSGSWLNAIKIFFAFIMLAFSLYFLGKIDQAYHLNLLNRDLFLCVWVVIFLLLGFYLLGKIKFAHDSELLFVGVPRLLFSVASFSFALYLFTGLLGAELKGLSTILPAGQKHGYTPAANTAGQTSGSNPTAQCNTPKYSDFLTLPHNLQGYFDYEEALACARAQNKPVLVDFVGHTCSNCKKMYAEVWSDPRVLKLLNEYFIVVAIYTDDKTKLVESEWINSKVDGKLKKNLGKRNQDFQITRFKSNALPLYAIVDGNGNDLSKSYYTYDPSVEKFIAWLESGIPQQ